MIKSRGILEAVKASGREGYLESLEGELYVIGLL